MANLLTRKVMDHMSRQYRNEKGMNSSSQETSKGNINPGEEAMLLGLINNKLATTNGTRGQSYQGVKKLNLEDLIGQSKQPEYKIGKCSSAITLEELVNKQGK